MDISIALKECELVDKKMHKTTCAIAKHLFDVHGFLKIENLFEKSLIQKLVQVVFSDLHFDKEKMTLSKGTQVAHCRYIVNIALASSFNDPDFYANPILLSLMREFLGPQFIMSSLGCVISLPGATDQHVHADYFPLFEENAHFVGMHPPFAIAIGIPLIDIDVINGPTKVWSGSHRTYPIDKDMHSYPMHLVCGPIGSCYFWDYRTFHAGGSNHSEEMRPLLYFSYTRRWFRDSLNPDRFQIAKDEYLKIPEEYRKLFL